MPTPRYSLGAAVLNNMIYCIGGMNMSGNVFSTIEVYDPAADTWGVKTSMPTARLGPGAAAVGGKIYVIGGSNLSQALTVNEEFDTTTNTWTSKASMPTRRYCLGCFSYGNKVYGLGGYDYTNYLTTVETYDTASNTWASETPMQHARQSVAVGFTGNTVYVIGGWNNGALAFNEQGVIQVTGEEEQAGEGSRGKGTAQLRVQPNPITQTAHISVSGENTRFPSQAWTLKIYDIQGRPVRQIPLTHSEAIWDGRDAQGIPMPNGVYFIQAAGDGKTLTQRVTVIH